MPRPEWYFLWLFQLLKYFKGSLEAVGTTFVPTILVALLAALPFLDRRRPRTRRLLPGTRPVRVWPRVVAAAIMALLLAATLLAATSTPASKPAAAAGAGARVAHARAATGAAHGVAERGSTL